MHIAAGKGHVAVVKLLLELRADANAPNQSSATPIHCAAAGGYVDMIKTLVEHGADVNSTDSSGYTPLHYASVNGHVNAIKVLVSLRCDIDLGANNGSSSLFFVASSRPISTLLVNLGADMKQCLRDAAPSEVAHIRDMIAQLCSHAGLPSSSDFNLQCAFFSMTKLVSSSFAFHEVELGPAINDVGTAHALFETEIAHCMAQHLVPTLIEQMHDTLSYVQKRRLVRIAWRICSNTLLVDGDRVSMKVKLRRYVELMMLMLDLTMLGDVLALRMSCKSNSKRKRFPVGHTADSCYEELEANIIEEWLGCCSSRFVSTCVIHAVVAIHIHA